MDEVTLRTFPRNEAEALAMLYMQNQDIKGFSPVDLLEMYQTAYNEICEELDKQYAARFEEI